MVALLAVAGLLAAGATHEHLWVFAIDYLNDDIELSQMKALVNRAKTAGYTGLAVISGKDYTAWTRDDEADIASFAYRSANTGLEDLAHMRPDRLARFLALKAHCDSCGFDFVPLLWSTGYCSMQYKDTSYAAGWELRDVPYVACGGKAVFEPGVPLETDFSAHTRTINCASNSNRRVSTWIDVKPSRKYRVSLRMRTECMKHSADPGSGGPMVGIWSEAFAVGGQYETHCCPHLPPTSGGWRDIVFTFITDPRDSRVLLRTESGNKDKEGFVSFRDIMVEEMGLELPIRRDSTPFVVSDAATGRIFREGVDYAPVAACTSLRSSRPGCPSLELEILPGGAITEGAKLLVSDYEPKNIYGEQFGTCLTNPRLFDHYRDSARELSAALGVKRWFLSADEIRVGCHCRTCRANADTDGVRIGKNYRAQCAAIRATCPEAEIYMWPDMADVNHNAMDGYALMNDTTRGALPYVPTNVTMVCWWGQKSDIIPTYFAARGFRTMGAGYYDKETAAETRKSAEGWMRSLNDVPNARGLMYTTWDYGVGRNMAFLEDYADVFRSMSAPYAPTAGTELPRVMMSYNIRGGRGNAPDGEALDKGERETHLSAVAAVIAREKPDWVAIQEADNYARRSDRQNQMRVLGEKTGLFPVFGQAFRVRGGQGEGAYGVGLLSHARPLDYRVIPFPDADEDRVLLICEFAAYTVVVTHFSPNPSSAAEMARTVVREFGNPEKPIFLAGDLNTVPGSEVVVELGKAFVALSDNTRPTYPTNPAIRAEPKSIDWIFVDRAHAAAYGSARGVVLDDATGSDHFPVLVR